MCPKALQLIMISTDNHNITRLLLLMIIDSGKKCTILIIDKQNISVAPIIGSAIGNTLYQLIFSYQLSDQYVCQITS